MKTADQFESTDLSLVQLEKIDRAYSSEPWWYDVRGFLILTFSYQSTLPYQLRLFGNNFGKKHLEAAVGTGTLLDLVLKWRSWKGLPESQITAFDYADRMLDGARKRFQNCKQMRLLRADVTCLDHKSDSFDTVNVANAFHCFPDVRSGIAELFRVLRPGGKLAGNVLLHPKGKGLLARIARKINAWGMRKGILQRPYAPDEFRKELLEAGFRMVSEEIHGNTLSFLVEKPAQTRTPTAGSSYEESFSRNIGVISSPDQEKLMGARVAIAGLGGVGGTYAVTLARMGVGRFHISDMDTFEAANFNRQAGATTRTVGVRKTEAIRDLILSINPRAEVRIFEGGISTENIDAFLSEVDVVMDGIDFYALSARRLLFLEAERRGIYTITSGPIGLTTTLHVFGPGAMSFERYFDFASCKNRLEELVAFAVGVAPSLLQLGQIDPKYVDFENQKAPSFATAIQLCGGLACNEALQILLSRRTPFLAPRYLQFDPVKLRLVRKRLHFGNRGMIQRLKRIWAARLLRAARPE